MQRLKEFFIGIFTAFFSFFGLLAIPLLLLIGANITDYVTGIIASTKRNEKIKSYKSIKGIYKKISMYILIIVGFMVDVLINYTTSILGLNIGQYLIFSCLITLWLVCNELISILENLVYIKKYIPPFLMPIINKVKDEIESEGKK